MGIDHRVISTANPRANGLIERYNRVIKEGLRKMVTLVGTIAWDEVLRGPGGTKHVTYAVGSQSPFDGL